MKFYTIKSIKKRDGSIVKFDKNKITEAIFKAAKAEGGSDWDLAKQLTEKVVAIIEYNSSIEKILTVEEIQDIIERVLIKTGHAKTAKAYILYREQRKKLRETKGTFLDIKSSIEEYLEKTDWRLYENSNTDYSFSGLMSHTAEKIMANYVLNEVYISKAGKAHRNADLQIHDLGYNVVAYCCGWSLLKLLMDGFGGVKRKIRSLPAKHLDVACNQIINFIGTMQLEHAGAQALSSVDTLLAPFIKKDNLSFKKVKQCMQMLVFSLNVPSRWACQAPFTNFTFDWTVPEDMKNKPVIIGGITQDFNYEECQKEMDMLNKAFIEVMIEGDADERTFFYPIPTYNITKDFDWESENAKLLFEMTTKYGTPYFQNFINSDLNPSDIRSMCCRLQLDLKELRNKMGGLFGAGDQTGSIGVVTINMPRIGYLSKNEKEFFERLEAMMDIAKEALETKRKIINKNMEAGLMPFSKRFLGNYNNHFSTIGLNGMHEALLNLIGKGIQTDEGKTIAIKTLKFMREKISRFQQETGNLYNLEAVPCESATYRFAKKDKEFYPDIITAGTKESPYYTNSTQLPVDYTEDIFEALEHQDELQLLYTGGTVLHGFLGEKIDDWKTTMKLVKKIAFNFRLPYFTITPTFSICPEHGYIKGEHFNCPNNIVNKETKEVIKDEMQPKNRGIQQNSGVLQATSKLE